VSAADRGEVLWAPPTDAWSATAAGRFASAHGFTDYPSLHAWSIGDGEGFWRAATEFTAVRWRERPAAMCIGDEMPDVSWFPGGTLNYTEHALGAAATRSGEVAVVARSQTRGPIDLTWAELAAEVGAAAAGLQRLGVGAGDRVAAYAPNLPETLVAFLATASLGAVWASCAPEFGVRAVIDRFAQIEPKVLVAVDGYRYGTRAVGRGEEVAAIVASLPTLGHLVHVGYLDAASAPPPSLPPDVTAVTWSELVGSGRDGSPAPVEVAADHPLYVLFSSGTTGVPKAIVHGHGGIVAEHLKVLRLHQDVGPGDRFFWFTTTGWMMWNYLVSGLLTGATIVLFDGDPSSPSLDTLWDLAAETGITVFGVSAPFLMACRKSGVRPPRGELRWVGSTGAPLPASGFRWVHDAVGVPVSSISGGTDVCTAFVGSSPLVPVRAGEISCRLLGCAVDAFTPDGRPCPPGVTGELVLTAPMPSMPVGFWGDDEGSRYRAAYFADYPGVWRHGDWITFTEDGACVISGRSDATLNRGGVRLGTSDFYAVVEGFEEVADSLVVHLEDEDDDDGTGLGRLVLFVALAPGAELDDDLAARIRDALRRDLSPRHVPDAIEAVPAVPRTLSGKKLEVPVKRILSGTPADEAASRDALIDPGALDYFIRVFRAE
jgi:acetoacetyl-CoA synthetase